ITVSAVSPWRTALQRDTCFPASVLGPVLLSALRRLASICLYEVMVSRFPNRLRFAILNPRADVSSAKGCELWRQHRYRTYPTKRLHHHNDGPRDDGHGRAGL